MDAKKYKIPIIDLQKLQKLLLGQLMHEILGRLKGLTKRLFKAKVYAVAKTLHNLRHRPIHSLRYVKYLHSYIIFDSLLIRSCDDAS